VQSVVVDRPRYKTPALANELTHLVIGYLSRGAPPLASRASPDASARRDSPSATGAARRRLA
jgi:hypothetical protein